MTEPADNTSLLDRLARLESQNALLLAEKGIPADPIAAQVKNLKDHLTARAAMTPQHDFSEFQALLDTLPEEGMSSKHTAPIAFAVSRWEKKYPGIVGELGYVVQLAEDLHEMVLKAESEQ